MSKDLAVQVQHPKEEQNIIKPVYVRKKNTDTKLTRWCHIKSPVSDKSFSIIKKTSK